MSQNRNPKGIPTGGQFAAKSSPESDVKLAEVNPVRSDGLNAEIGSMGLQVSRVYAPKGSFAIDFNNAIVGSPYLEGTGWYPDLETAQTAAALMIPRINNLAARYLAENPSAGDGWVHPEEEASSSYATISSAEDDEGQREDDPIFEEQYDGDEWLVASVELGLMDEAQSRRVERVTEVQADADAAFEAWKRR